MKKLDKQKSLSVTTLNLSFLREEQPKLLRGLPVTYCTSGENLTKRLKRTYTAGRYEWKNQVSKPTSKTIHAFQISRYDGGQSTKRGLHHRSVRSLIVRGLKKRQVGSESIDVSIFGFIDNERCFFFLHRVKERNKTIPRASS